jgi:hypothetical protein
VIIILLKKGREVKHFVTFGLPDYRLLLHLFLVLWEMPIPDPHACVYELFDPLLGHMKQKQESCHMIASYSP